MEGRAQITYNTWFQGFTLHMKWTQTQDEIDGNQTS